MADDLRVAVLGAAGRMGSTVCAAVEAAPGLELVATVDAPYVDLDPAHFRTIGAFDQRLPTAPSLAGATSLRVRGDWTFGRDVAIVGDAVLTDGGAPSTVPDGAWVGPTGIA